MTVALYVLIPIIALALGLIMYIISSKDKGKAFMKSLIILMVLTGIISIIGYLFFFAKDNETLQQIINFFKK